MSRQAWNWCYCNGGDILTLDVGSSDFFTFRKKLNFLDTTQLESHLLVSWKYFCTNEELHYRETRPFLIRNGNYTVNLI